MKSLNKEGFIIEFNDTVLDVIDFDSDDIHSPQYHGLNHAMKAVDVIAEFPEECLFIEMKDYSMPNAMRFRCPFQSKRLKDYCERADENSQLKKICADIRSKFYETFLYRYAEGKVSKPIFCIALAKLDSAMLHRLNEQLKSQMPIGKACKRWRRELFCRFVAVDESMWNKLFSEKYGITHIAKNLMS